MGSERDLAKRALDTAVARGASYADVRITRRDVEAVLVQNGHLDSVERYDAVGFGVRVIADGAWGFAGSQLLTHAEADRVAASAVELAHAAASVNATPVHLAPRAASHGTYVTPVLTDPFAIPFDERLKLLTDADAAMRLVKGVRTTRADYEIRREEKLFLSSDGSDLEQRLTETGCGIVADAVGDNELQIRSYPSGHARNQNTGGWEYVERWDLVGNAPRVAEEAVALLTAKQCPDNVRTTLIVSGSHLMPQLHETCGHPIELDRVLGNEVMYAGSSFLTTEKLDSFRYGSELVNIRIDSTTPGGLGTFGWDDEGVAATERWAVKDGMFVGYLMSRETAAALGTTSNGTMRADGGSRLPLIRMTNVSLMPGDAGTLQDLIGATDDGIFMDMNKTWFFDDRRYNFQFGAQIAWEVKGGKLGAMLRNPKFTGITPEFWGSCDAICSASEWIPWGTPNCGKGQPGQVMNTGHGAAPARFRNIRIGAMK